MRVAEAIESDAQAQREPRVLTSRVCTRVPGQLQGRYSASNRWGG